MKVFFLLGVVILTFFSCSTPNPEERHSEHLELVSLYFKHFNDNDWAAMASMYTESAEFRDPSFGIEVVMQTRQQIIDKYEDLNKSIPDLYDSVTHVYPAGKNHIVVEFISTGTQPDGKKFKLPICTIFTIEDGLITKDYTYFDN